MNEEAPCNAADAFKAKLQALVNNLQAVGDALALRELYPEAGVVHAAKQTIPQLYARLLAAEAQLGAAVMDAQAPVADEGTCQHP